MSGQQGVGKRSSPYRGLEPFDEHDAAFFFGREREARLITANLFASPLTLLYGASGVGKSSVLRAGVLPSLRKRKDLLPVVFPNVAGEGQATAGSLVVRGWQNDPVEGIKATVAVALFASAGNDQTTLRHFREVVQKRETAPLREFLDSCHEASGLRLMVILDQFEEYFLYHPEDDPFAEQFPGAIVPGVLRVSFLVSLREDALAKLDRFKGRISTLWDSYRRIDHLDQEAAKSAILGPIERFNRLEMPGVPHVAIESELVNAVLDEVRTGRVDLGQIGSGAVGPRSDIARIETPYLQLVMARLWDTEMRTISDDEMRIGSKVFRLQTLRELGNADRIVRTHLDTAMESLTPEHQDFASRVFRYLVTPSGAKIAHTANDLAEYADVPVAQLTNVLDTLSRGTVRILRPVAPPSGQVEASRYEIFHDVLAPAILDWRTRHLQAHISLQARIDTVDYIVVGSGAAGGPLAANLAEAGYSVLLLEAGGDPLTLSHPRLPEDYSVPAFHPFASQNEAMTWNFFVCHYTDERRQARDPRFTPLRGGFLYPRAGTLGGCTAINALILVYPHNADWNHIATLTNDPSWNAENMRKYFVRMENCRYRIYRTLAFRWLNVPRHGYRGWLSTERAIPGRFNRDLDLELARSAFAAAQHSRDPLPLNPLGWLNVALDPNDWRLVRQDSSGVIYTPLTTRHHARIGSRERILEVATRHKLRIALNALVTRVLFDNENRAIGVEYLKGERLYRAHPAPTFNPGEKQQAFASRETILCGGAFNTPQLLMLSGIGPRREIEKHGIPLRVDLPGVGRNLQDHYEVSLVSRLKGDLDLLRDADFSRHDIHYKEWEAKRSGPYATNGGLLGIVTKSSRALLRPDLFCLAMIGRDPGGYSGGSAKELDPHNYLSWSILKAHTNNQAGEVRLASSDPRDMPHINFHYFDEGSDSSGKDLDAMVEGIKLVRGVIKPLKQKGLIGEEELPGDNVQSDEELREFVRYNSWGRHASCTCPIGSDADPMAVLDGNFRVRGTRNLRVVDASIFPRTPGFFIVSSVYMVGEKASDVILADAMKEPERKAASVEAR